MPPTLINGSRAAGCGPVGPVAWQYGWQYRPEFVEGDESRSQAGEVACLVREVSSSLSDSDHFS